MCHHVPVRLSVEEQQAVRRLTGVMIPPCAVLMLAVIAGFALGPAPDRHEVVASAHAVDVSR